MTNQLKILHLEDQEADAELVRHVLNRNNISADIKIVDNKEAYIDALYNYFPDVILSDHSLPTFSSIEALSIFKNARISIPFIVVTGATSEEFAVSILKAGADDYILKDKLDTLPNAIITSLKKIEQQENLEKEKTLRQKEKTDAVITAQEKEKTEMGNALLENINQILAASNLYIDCAISDEDKRMQFMQSSKKFLLTAIDEIKKLSQVIMPATISEIGLIDSLKNLVEDSKLAETVNVYTDWKEFDEKLASQQLKLSIYRIVQEQLANILKHSGAKNASFSLHYLSNQIELVIKDDGKGFDINEPSEGVGLQNINTRAEMHDGSMLIESVPGKGTRLTIYFPI